MAGNDFVQVQLSQAGKKLADGNPLSIAQDRRSFIFMPGQSVRVERSFEWNCILKPYVSPWTDQPIFELVPEPAPQPAPASQTATSAAKAQGKAATTADPTPDPEQPSPAPDESKETAE